MAGRILSVHLLRLRQTLPLRSRTSSLKPSAVLLSRSLLGNFLSSRFSSSRRASSNAAGKEKSLVEEEAELSDWISDLKTDSLRVGFSSDNEDDSSNRRSSGRGTGQFKEGEKFRGGDRNLRSSRGSVKKRGFYSDGDDEERDYSEGFSPRRGRGGRGGAGMSVAQRGGRGKGFGGRGGRGGRGGKDLDFDFSDEERGSRSGGFSSGRRGGGAGRSERLRGGKGSRGGTGMGFGSSEEETSDESGKGFSSRRIGGGARTSVRQRGGKTGRGGRDLGFVLSEEEIGSDSDEAFSGFETDFIAEERDKKEGLSGAHTGTGFRSEKSDEGESVEITARSSDGDDNSYLSKKR